MLKRSGGARQRIWNVLLAANRPLSLAEIVRLAGGSEGGAKTYLSGLRRHGYLADERRGDYVLAKKTGPEAPAFSAQTGELRDWNTDPPMPRSELMRALETHGGSVSAFCRDIGLSGNTVSRIMQMLRGQRPITTNVEEAVRAWLEPETEPAGEIGNK